MFNLGRTGIFTIYVLPGRNIVDFFIDVTWCSEVIFYRLFYTSFIQISCAFLIFFFEIKLFFHFLSTIKTQDILQKMSTIFYNL